jgi:hypothetical protein
MNRLILQYIFIFLGILSYGFLNADCFRPNIGIGYTNSYGKDASGFGYHIGGRFLLEAGSNKKYGLEITYISAVTSENKNYVSIGIVLEQNKYDWFNMSIGTIGYINIKDSTKPFGIVTNLGWERKISHLSPFITYRTDWIFDKVILNINSISMGITF